MSTSSDSTVLLLSDDARASLTACRALADEGLSVHVASIGQRSVASRSRFCDKYIALQSAERNAPACGTELLAQLQTHQYELLIPVSDTACLLVQRYREEIEKHTRIALTSSASFRYAHDKAFLLEKCQEMGIPVPSTRLIQSVDDLKGLEYPVILKPAKSVEWVDKHIVHFQVYRAPDIEKAEAYIADIIDSVPILAQSICPGHGVSLHFTAKEGQIINVVQQNRLHEPPAGGGSSYRMTTEINPQLLDACRQVVVSSNWTGPAMLELRGIPSEGRYWVMELNGRLWGSLALTESAGFPVCKQTYEIFTDRIPQPVARLQTGVRQRHLGKDLAWLARQPQKFPSWLGDLRHLIIGRERLDVETLRDPKAALYYWVDALAKPFVKIQNAIRRFQALSSYRSREAELKQQAAEILKNPDSKILFICHGNICRSPFAHYYLEQIKGWKNVRSAGFYQRPPRRVPPTSKAMAAEHFGIDLEPHRSQPLTQELLDWADLAFVMDARNLYQLQDYKQNTPCLLLGSMGAGKAISDPWNKAPEEYLRTFNEISSYLQELKAHDPVPVSTR